MLKRLMLWCKIFTVALLLLSLSPWLVQWHMVFELGSHFVLQYLVVGLGFSLVFVLSQRFLWLLPSLAVVLINAVLLWPVLMANKPITSLDIARSERITILHANVLTSNEQRAPLLSLINQQQPDIILLQEVDRAWLADLSVLESDYPVQHLQPRGDNFGIALFSKIAIDDVQTLFLGSDLPSITGSVSVNGSRFQLLSTHPLPPVNQSLIDLRNLQLKAVQAWARRQGDSNLLIMGDLNISQFSPHFKALQNAELHNCRDGFGLLPTWPASNPVLQIALDHCLVKGLQVTDFKLGDDIGSDHLPILVELGFN